MAGLPPILTGTKPRWKDHPLDAVRHIAPKGTGRPLAAPRSGSLPPTGCPVCFRVACPLRSHKQYAKSRRLYGTPTAVSSRQFLTSVNTTSSTESLEGRQGEYPHLTQISAGEVDPFVAFPLPNGAKVEVHQLFQDCKLTGLSLGHLSLLLAGHCLTSATITMS